MRYPFYTKAMAMIGLIVAVSTRADIPAEKPRLTVYSDVVGAKDILDEQYVSGIEKTLGAHSENRIFVYNNLCVAYLLSKQMSHARTVCQRALEETFSSRNYGDWFHRTQSSRTRREYQDRARAHLKLYESAGYSTTRIEPLLPQAGRLRNVSDESTNATFDRKDLPSNME